MPVNPVQQYLKFANLQIGAEAFLDRVGTTYSVIDPTGNVKVREGTITNVLEDGNGHTSKFPPNLAEQFANEWVIVDQRKNIQADDGGTGFSGTLFRSRKADAAGKFEYVISFRSTEFLDDAVRDSRSTNELEIKDHGWALGQIAEMEQWYFDLKSSTALHPTPLLPEGQRFYVTGYSLGGHLATAFNILRREQGDLRRLIHTYMFNGVGTGTLRNGQSLTNVRGCRRFGASGRSSNRNWYCRTGPG